LKESGLEIEGKYIKVFGFKDSGGMAEWLKAAVLKTASPKRDVGSNPTPSASLR
jgi:hypothetical protein